MAGKNDLIAWISECVSSRKQSYLLALAIFMFFFFLGYISPGILEYYKGILLGNTFSSPLSLFVFLVANNALIALLGTFSGILFGIVPAILLCLNGYMLGDIAGMIITESGIYQLVLSYLPHGLFEIPSIILSLGFGISGYAVLQEKKTKQFFHDGAIVYLGLIFPLLLAGAVIETLWITYSDQWMPFLETDGIQVFLSNLMLAFLIYGAVKSLILYIEKRDFRIVIMMSLFVLISTRLWVASYSVRVIELLQAFSFLATLLPLMLILLYLYLENVAHKERIKKKFIQGAFSQYVSQEIVSRLVAHPEQLKLGGERRFMTVLFLDARSFTTISEEESAENLVAMMNEYFTRMTNIIIEHHGVVDKFIGDAIMAFWNAPAHDKDHAKNACGAAYAMQQELHELNAKFKSEGKRQINARIGINTGWMVSGNMGSDKRFDYTVIGDAVNLASRLESLNKFYGTKVLITEYTKDAAPGPFRFREIDRVRVKGKYEPIVIYQLLGYRKDDKGEYDGFSKGLDLFLERRFKEAQDIFIEIAARTGDPVSEMYAQRCEMLINEPPGDEWEPIWEIETK